MNHWISNSFFIYCTHAKHKAGLWIRSFTHLKERPWAIRIRSHRSLQKSNCERFPHVALYKRAMWANGLYHKKSKSLEKPMSEFPTLAESDNFMKLVHCPKKIWISTYSSKNWGHSCIKCYRVYVRVCTVYGFCDIWHKNQTYTVHPLQPVQAWLFCEDSGYFWDSVHCRTDPCLFTNATSIVFITTGDIL